MNNLYSTYLCFTSHIQAEGIYRQRDVYDRLKAKSFTQMTKAHNQFITIIVCQVMIMENGFEAVTTLSGQDGAPGIC